jgi:hypothetical protein
MISSHAMISSDRRSSCFPTTIWLLLLPHHDVGLPVPRSHQLHTHCHYCTLSHMLTFSIPRLK